MQSWQQAVGANFNYHHDIIDSDISLLAYIYITMLLRGNLKLTGRSTGTPQFMQQLCSKKKISGVQSHKWYIISKAAPPHRS
jgi:hypothetical protein